MSAAPLTEVHERQVTDPWTRRLDELLTELHGLVSDCTDAEDADRVDRLTRLERLRSVTAAAQAAECVRFAQGQVETQLAQGTHPEKIGRGIAEQIGLACRLSPTAGAKRLNSARSWWFDLPETFGLLAAGHLSESVAEAVVSETRHLDAATRRAVDAKITADGVTGMGYRTAVALARRHAYDADPQAYVARGRTERKNRRVSLRPAPDTMAILTGFLPVEQGVACYAALRKHTDATVAAGDRRTRDQIMADTLVERLTGQTTAEDVNVELNLTMPLDALIDPKSTRSARLDGYGPLPAELARRILAVTPGRVWWRRLFTAPTGEVVGGDPTRRRFDGWLGQLLRLRDQVCRDPYCDAPIRHLDHIERWADGGATTLANGRGTCVRGNQVRELPGWRIELIHPGDDGRPHTVQIITPTGHRYLSRAPDPP